MKYFINAWNVHTEAEKRFGPFSRAPQMTYDMLRDCDTEGDEEIAVYKFDNQGGPFSVLGKQISLDGWDFGDGFVATDFVIYAERDDNP